MTIIAVLLSFLISPLEADALRETAPLDLSPRDAFLHLSAARIAAASYDVSAADLLAVAHHESRYTPTAVTHEYARACKKCRRVWIGDSCGVGTPLWRLYHRCDPWELTIMGGYAASAMHLAEWARIYRGNRLRALGGYSGWAMDTQEPGAHAWQRFAWRAARIQRAITEAGR